MIKKICIFGDGITWGAGGGEQGGYCSRLKAFFQSNEYNLGIYNCGISGNNTNDLIERFLLEAKSRAAENIIFAIGTNDASFVITKENPLVSKHKFKSNLEELVARARILSKKIAFVGLFNVDEAKTAPTLWDENIYYDQATIAVYDTIIKKVAKEQKVDFIEMIDLLDKNDYLDGLHPNSAGHKKVFDRLREYLINV